MLITRNSRAGIFLSSVIVVLAAMSSHLYADDQPNNIPAWLQARIGDGDQQIALPILIRARELYMQKVSEGIVNNPCYFAMDATRPNDLAGRSAGGRFYVICEARRTFRAIAAGHGGGRSLRGIADFTNDRRCARNFSNALDSTLTAGGAYLTSEIKTSFKGYYRTSANGYSPWFRSFVQFDGVGETANARVREIGGHAAMLLRNTCRRKDPTSPYADRDGYVPVGKLVDYTAGRSDGCTSWAPSEAQRLIGMIENRATTLYIYPQSQDIDSVSKAVAAGRPLSQSGLYWNSACLKEIGSPKFWPKDRLERVIARYKENQLSSPAQQLPICQEP